MTQIGSGYEFDVFKTERDFKEFCALEFPIMGRKIEHHYMPTSFPCIAAYSHVENDNHVDEAHWLVLNQADLPEIVEALSDSNQ